MQGPDPRRLALLTSTEIKRVPEASAAAVKFGTGYFVTKTLVLTAFHNISSKRDTTIDVRVEEGEPTWRKGCRVVWKDEVLDAALIETLEPLAADIPPVVWAEALPADNAAWKSTAYPHAAIRKVASTHDYKTAGLQGRLYVAGGGGQGRRELELGVDDAPEAEAWKGASGAPVFVDGALIGLIKSTGWDGNRFHGTPAASLWQDVAFRLKLDSPWLDLPGDGNWVLALRSETGLTDFGERVENSLQRYGAMIAKVTGKGLAERSVVEVCIGEALETPERWLKLVEALGTAQLMIVDVTSLEPGIMLALGVRAVVRRGVTVASTSDDWNDAMLATLPFNIQETKLISHADSSADPISRDSRHWRNTIAKTLLNGILEQRSNPRYLDLPAYDAVRCAPPDFAVSGLDPWESILALCSFHVEYASNWTELLAALAMEYPEGGVVRMRDIVSPRLVGQALYEQIRWAKLCVIDWTHWRPNVFFEHGVRLACSRLEPVLLLEQAVAPPASSQEHKLISLFAPTRYAVGNLRPAVKAALETQRDEQTRVGERGESFPRARHLVPHNGTYNVSLVAFDYRQERVTLPPHDFLRLSNETTLGKDRQRVGESPVLFAANVGFGVELARSARERWVAAWLYLRNRYSDQALRADPALRGELERLGEILLLELKSVSDDPFISKLRDEVLDFIDQEDDPIPALEGG